MSLCSLGRRTKLREAAMNVKDEIKNVETHFKHKLQFSTFFQEKFKKSRWPPLFIAGKDDNTKTTGLSTTRGLSFISTRSGTFQWKFSRRMIYQIEWSPNTLFKQYEKSFENVQLDFRISLHFFVYRLWTTPVGKFHSIFRGLKGNRVLYGNSFESDDTEDFPKASKPNKYDQHLYYVALLCRYSILGLKSFGYIPFVLGVICWF